MFTGPRNDYRGPLDRMEEFLETLEWPATSGRFSVKACHLASVLSSLIDTLFLDCVWSRKPQG